MKAALLLAVACNIALTASLPADTSSLSTNPYLTYLNWAASRPSSIANYDDLDIEDNQNLPQEDFQSVEQDSRSDDDIEKRSNSKWNMRMFKKANYNKWQQRLFKRPDKWQQRMFKRPNSNKWEMRMFKRGADPWKMRMFKRPDQQDILEQLKDK